VSTSSERAGNHPGGSYHHGNLRKALLKEGVKLLEEVGEARFSLRELARRVGVTANAAYRHFANKEALLMGLAAEGFQLFGSSQASAWQKADGDVAEKFLATGGNYVRFARRHPALFRLMFGRFAAEHRSDTLDSASKTAFDMLQQGVAAAVGLPASSGAARLAAYNAWAVVHGFSHLILDGQIRETTTDVEKMVESALRQWLSARE
jgi:AcrR family transcriptional regulator